MFQKLVAHLAGARALELAPGLRRLERLGRLDIDARPRRKPLRQALEQRRQRILPERRIEENHVEALRASFQVVERIGEDQLDLLCPYQSERLLESRKDAAVGFDHDDAR